MRELCKKKGKVVYGQEPPSGESTTTECGFNYQLLAVITAVAQWGAPSCSQPQPATEMASETVDPIDWSYPPPYTGQYPLSSTYCTLQCGLQITTLASLSQPRTCDIRMPDQRTAGAATQGIIHSVSLQLPIMPELCVWNSPLWGSCVSLKLAIMRELCNSQTRHKGMSWCSQHNIMPKCIINITTLRVSWIIQ